MDIQSNDVRMQVYTNGYLSGVVRFCDVDINVDTFYVGTGLRCAECTTLLKERAKHYREDIYLTTKGEHRG